MEDPSSKEDKSGVLKVLEALKQASHELKAHPTPNSAHSNSSAIKALLELQTESDSILSKDPHLSTLSQHLADLKTLLETLEQTRGYGLRSFLTRRVSTHSISRVAGSIESEIQAWIDRESIESLIKGLEEPWKNEDELVRLLTQFENRVSQGFNRELQNLILKSKAFLVLQSVLCDLNCSKRIRENAAFCVAGLIRFNKDVFVGQVNNMGDTIHALLDMRSIHCLKVLCQLIKFTKSPFVDEIVCNGEIPKILNLLDSKDLDMKVLAFHCILEIGYLGRKEAVEALLKGGLIDKLVELQRSELGGDLIEMGNSNFGDENNKEKQRIENKFLLQNHPFASCVARFAVQLEVGEGLRQREKRAFKQEILRKVREASVSDAEAATVIAEVLWGSSP